MKRLPLIFIIIFFISPLRGDVAEEFDFLYGASFAFKNGIPYIRAHIKSYQNGVEIGNISSFECNDKTVKADSFKISPIMFREAVVKYKIAFQELSQKELKNYAEKLNEWREKTDLETEIFVNGAIFSVNRSTIDNREYFVATKELFDKEDSEERINKYRRLFPQSSIFSIPVLNGAARSVMQLKTSDGKYYNCSNLVAIRSKEKEEFVVGKDSFEGGATYFLTPSSVRKIELAIEDSVENLVKKILPGELFLSSPLETLKAQAVAARTDVFMQLGKRHIAEPWHICSKVHCQKILWGEPSNPKFVQAVEETKGEILIYGGTYVARAPYCSSSGGKTEDIRNVWFTAEKPYLRGVWDGDKILDLDLSKENDFKAFLAMDYGEDNIQMNKRRRWEVTFSQEKIDELINKTYKIGKLKSVKPLSCGVSGRVYKIEFVGEESSAELYGELNIRKLLNNLYSSAFVVSHVNDEWIFKGMGWGHGVGMSQMGAISLGRKNRDFKFILQKYYPGTDIIKIY